MFIKCDDCGKTLYEIQGTGYFCRECLHEVHIKGNYKVYYSMGSAGNVREEKKVELTPDEKDFVEDMLTKKREAKKKKGTPLTTTGNRRISSRRSALSSDKGGRY